HPASAIETLTGNGSAGSSETCADVSPRAITHPATPPRATNNSVSASSRRTNRDRPALLPKRTSIPERRAPSRVSSTAATMADARALEPLGGDAGDGKGLAIAPDRSTDDGGVPGEAPRAEAMAQHDNRVGPRSLRQLGVEQATRSGCRTEYAEIVGRDGRAKDPLGR